MKILGFAGSLRTDSYNQQIIKNALKIAEEMSAQTEFLDLHDLKMPLYDTDIETSDYLKEAKKLKEMIRRADAVVISSPEYNRSIPGVLKNALDWASRPHGESAFEDKPTALVTASPGSKGGARAMEHLTQVMEALGTKLSEKKVSIGEVRDKLDKNGNLTDGEAIESIKQLLHELIQISQKQPSQIKA